jgi:hypothetical protein
MPTQTPTLTLTIAPITTASASSTSAQAFSNEPNPASSPTDDISVQPTTYLTSQPSSSPSTTTADPASYIADTDITSDSDPTLSVPLTDLELALVSCFTVITAIIVVQKTKSF